MTFLEDLQLYIYLREQNSFSFECLWNRATNPEIGVKIPYQPTFYN